MDFNLVALPTGVSKLSKFTNRKLGKSGIFTNVAKGTPVHVKAAFKFNDLLKYYKLDNTEPIRNKEKIKWAYMKNNPFGIDDLGFKGYDDAKEITDFIKQYIYYDRLFEGALQKKINMFYDAMSWDLPVDKKNTLERFF